LFAFDKDDQSLRLIENEGEILGKLEGIDIENDEYVFWDANGDGVSISVTVTAFSSNLNGIRSSAVTFPIREAFSLYAKSLALAGALPEGRPIDVWAHIQANLASRTRKGQ